MVGDDLPESKQAAVTSHLEKCAGCKREFGIHIDSNKAVKEWLDRERIEWNDFEWQRVVRTACRESAAKKHKPGFWPLKKGWAYASMVGVVVMLCLVIFRPQSTRKPAGAAPGAAAGRETRLLESKTLQPSQEIVAVKLVSRKTGVKIHWFLNKNLNMEEIE
jgi:hypothetical protein